MSSSSKLISPGNSPCVIWLWSALVAVAGGGPMCLVAATEPTGLDNAAGRSIHERLRISEFETVMLHTSRGNRGELNVGLRFGGQDHQLVLQRCSVRAPGFRLLVQRNEGKLVPVEPPPAATYRGYVAGLRHSRVTASQRNGLLQATVQLGPGRKDTWLIQPVSTILPEKPGPQHIIYRADAAQGSGGTCAVTDDPQENPLRGGTPPTRDTADLDVLVCELACDADAEFYQLNGGSLDDTVADIEMIVNGVSDIYTLDSRVTFQITAIIVRTAEPDPYTATNPLQLLGQFKGHWDLAQGDIVRDAAQLFTGKDLDGTALGIAYQDGLCWQEYSVVQSRYTAEIAERVALSAHEMGHLFDAGHCDGLDVWCRIMCSTLGGCSEGFRSFGPLSANRIRMGAVGASCLSPGTVGVPCTYLPFFDDFGYCGYYDVPDPARWTAADRVDCYYGKIVLRIGKDYGGNMRFGTLRTRPMAVTAPATISYRVNTNYVPTGQYLKVEYLDSQLYAWHVLQSIPATTGQAGWASHEHPMPLDGYGDYFALRFTGYGGTMSSCSWLIDDVAITPLPCVASLDGDDAVDAEDFAILAAAWLSTEGESLWNNDCDLSEPADGVIDLRDVLVFLNDWLCGK
ncbi:MAG: hypothetical protein JW810_06590 [Sedimentisphaerales bacterium]|nr:hypothetical protein [Sedimentisphaerales bacterium]